MQRHVRNLRFILLGGVLLATAASASFRAGQVCTSDTFAVRDGFVAARRGTCTVLAANQVRVDIRPERSKDRKKINNSPWYAFKVIPLAAGDAVISLRYKGGSHRYWPKISVDGLTWYPMDERYVAVSPDEREATITIPLDSTPVWIAAQEIISPAIYNLWNRKTSQATGVPLTLLGESKAGQPIHLFDTDPSGKDILFLLGRQHPPEVSGAFAFFAFTETVLGDTELAREFRERFRVIAIPVLNPDGITGGNWRMNLGGVDLNRDWGKFDEPETALVGRLLRSLDADGARLRMFIDFHSTKRNVFYTQEKPTDPPGFTRRWLETARPLVPDYRFRIDPGPGKNRSVAKNHIYARYGVPSITYEVGDETDRAETRKAARILAEELMRQMLREEY